MSIGLKQDAPELQAKKPEYHERYNFKDGYVTFLVEEKLFVVHKYFFKRDSRILRKVFESERTKSGADGNSPGDTVVPVPDISCFDLESFLSVLYPASFGQYTATTVSEWSSILLLATKWEFTEIRNIAVDKLTLLSSPVDKLVLSRKHGIAQWRAGAYRELCKRSDPLTVEEGDRLGMKDVINISEARQRFRCSGDSSLSNEAMDLAEMQGVWELLDIDDKDSGVDNVSEGTLMDAGLEGHMEQFPVEDDVLISPSEIGSYCMDPSIGSEPVGVEERVLSTGSHWNLSPGEASFELPCNTGSAITDAGLRPTSEDCGSVTALDKESEASVRGNLEEPAQAPPRSPTWSEVMMAGLEEEAQPGDPTWLMEEREFGEVVCEEPTPDPESGAIAYEEPTPEPTPEPELCPCRYCQRVGRTSSKCILTDNSERKTKKKRKK